MLRNLLKESRLPGLEKDAMMGKGKVTEERAWQNPRLGQRIPELDGIRGLAILLVLVSHYVVNAAPEARLGSWQAYALVVLRLSWSGVDLFFVLSGFLIGGILLDVRDSPRYYGTFYARRVHRIFPLYYLWLAAFFGGLAVTGPSSSPILRQLFNSDVPSWSYVLFLQNVCMSYQQAFGAEWLGITWSLAVEEQFYVLLPLLVRNLSRRGVVWVAVAAIVIAPIARLALWMGGNSYIGPYTLLPCRADALGFGVLIALACRHRPAWEWLAAHRRQLVVALFALALGIVYLLRDQRFLFVAGLTWIAMFYGVLVLLALVNPSRGERLVLRSWPLTKLGLVAYAVYMFHQGINRLLHWVCFRSEPSVGSLSQIGVTVAALLAVLALSALSWRVMEKPLIRRAHARFQY